MIIKQISIFLENHPSELAKLTTCLSNAKINLRAISVAEASDFGIVRIITDDVFNAVTALKNSDYICSLADVLAVEISDEPGALANVISSLGSEGINVEYMYAETSNKNGVACMIIRVSDTPKAAAILEKKAN